MPTRLPKDPAYRKIGGGLTATGSASYWLAQDHLILVETKFVVEQYRRFELHALECVVVQPTTTRRLAGGVVGIAFLAVASLAGLTGYRWSIGASGDAPLWFALASIPTVVLAAAFAWIVIPGQFCRIRIRTGVQTFAAPGLNRLPRARRFIAALRAAVATQAAVPATEPVRAPTSATVPPEPAP
jgi:hypothetical protein